MFSLPVRVDYSAQLHWIVHVCVATQCPSQGSRVPLMCETVSSIFLFLLFSVTPVCLPPQQPFIQSLSLLSASPSSFPFIVLSTLVVIFISNKPPPTLVSFLLFSFIHYSRLSLPVSHFYVRPFPFLVCFLSLPPFSYSLFIICRICPSFLVGSVTSLLPLPSPFLGAPALLLV